jgi:hypothetical protein
VLSWYWIALWVNRSFQTALGRALREGLPPDETIRADETIYFPAQCEYSGHG